MNTLNELSPVDQFIVLRQFMGTDLQPYRGVPGPVLAFRVNNRPERPSQPEDALFEPPVRRIDLRSDDRIRFTDQGTDVKTKPRACRPWLQAHPAAMGRASGACIVRLTSEGRRRLCLLNDLIETQQAAPVSVGTLMDSLS